MKNLQRPNLFDFATSELSQDAFLAWFFSWADNEFDSDKVLQQCARGFLTKYIKNKYKDFDEPIVSVEVQRQYKHIDVLLTVNELYKVVIEDKTNTNIHGTQLEEYKDVVNNSHPVLLYIKTGNESLSEKEKIKEKGYEVIYRRDLLDMLNSCSSKNEIFTSYLEKLNEAERQTMSFKDKPKNQWLQPQIQGFYMELENQIKTLGWYYVNNKTGGFWCHLLNWNNDDEVALYAQLEDGRLCIKIGELAEGYLAYKADVRERYHRIVMRMASEMNIPISKPQRFGYGEYMTIAVAPDEYVYENGSCKFAKDRIVEYITLTEKCHNQIQLFNNGFRKKLIEKMVAKGFDYSVEGCGVFFSNEELHQRGTVMPVGISLTGRVWVGDIKIPHGTIWLDKSYYDLMTNDDSVIDAAVNQAIDSIESELEKIKDR